MSRHLLAVVTGVLLLGEMEATASPLGAFWSSLLIPGWGQYDRGDRSNAVRFFAIDVGLWAGVAGFRRLSDIRKDHYRSYAGDHAGAQASDKGKQFLDDLGFYDSRLQHNEVARRRDGADAVLYDGEPEFHWEWDAEESRTRYRELRNSSEGAKRQALFATGFLVVNRLVSAIHAAKLTRTAAKLTTSAMLPNPAADSVSLPTVPGAKSGTSAASAGRLPRPGFQASADPVRGFGLALVQRF